LPRRRQQPANAPVEASPESRSTKTTTTKKGKAQRAFPASTPTPSPKETTMKRVKMTKPAAAEMPPPRSPHAPAPAGSVTSRLWRRLPTIMKIVLMMPLAMALLGAEIELHLAPQLDVILTAAGVWAMWAWLAGGPLAAM